jgi:hypothetical protein
LFSELQVTTVAVSDLRASVDFYSGVFGYASGATVALSGADLERVWQMPPGTRAQCAVLGPPGSTSRASGSGGSTSAVRITGTTR